METAVEQLPAPHSAVGAVSRSIEDGADRIAELPVLGQAGSEVGMTALNSDQFDAVTLTRVLGRQILRMRSCATTSGTTANSRSK